MTKSQLDALQSYVAAVVRIMTGHSGDHGANVRLILDSKKRLEAAFGQSLDPPYDFGPVDLFNVPSSAKRLPDPDKLTRPVFPDIL